MTEKVFVDMIVIQYKSGSLKPLYLVWEDGRKYQIDKVLDIRKAASLKAGGRGIRYTCRIQGQIKNLFLEDDRWFIEKDILYKS